MKRKISLILCVFVLAVTALAVGVSAQTFEPDSYGQYTVPLSFEANNEYILIVLKGEYDQTNYIEAYNNAEDSDILYFEQSVSDGNGDVVFGPFVPAGYFDATLIVGGTNFEEPFLAGYLSADGVSNAASITMSGISQSYTVKGTGSADIKINVKTEVFDTFGYPCATNEEVKLELVNNLDDVTIDGNVITISKTAKEQAFTVKATAGDASKTAYVVVKREAPLHSFVEVYADEECTEPVSDITVQGVAGVFPNVTIYAKTFDQYGDVIDDEYTYHYQETRVDSVFTPVQGNRYLEVRSKNSVIMAVISVNAVSRPDYQGDALELYNLIVSAKQAYDARHTVSDENGRDIFPEEKWTTQESVNALLAAIESAEEVLLNYGTEGYDEYTSEASSLEKAIAAYNNSLKPGVRKDVTSISIADSVLVKPISTTAFKVTATTEPAIRLTTDRIVWTSSDSSVATVDSDGNVIAKASGKVTITATTRGGLTATSEITVVKKATKITLTPSSAVATYRGNPTVLVANVSPTDCTDVIEWKVEKPEFADIVISEDGRSCTVVPKAAGTTKITVTALHGAKSAVSTVTVVMPEWETAQTPVSDTESGSVLPGTAVSLSCATPGTTIYYTLDGTDPARETARIYNAPIVISRGLTLKAMAVGENLYDSAVATYEYKTVETSVKLSDALVRPGTDAELSLSVTDFENVTDAQFEVKYDSDNFDGAEVVFEEIEGVEFEYTDDKENGVIGISIHSQTPVNLDGIIAAVKLSVNASANAGEYIVEVACVGGMSDVAANNGYVTVKNYAIGDANGDGKIGLGDVLAIKRHLAENETAKMQIIPDAADVDRDGDIDNDDVVLLSKYCTGWDVKLGKSEEDVSVLRIISKYEVSEDDDGNWRYYYEVYEPLTGKKTFNVPSSVSASKPSKLAAIPALEAGTVVKLTTSGNVYDSNPVGTLSFDNLVWIKNAYDGEMVVVPVDSTVECKECVSQYMEGYKGSSYKDAFGNDHSMNSVIVTDNTKFSVMKQSDLSENFFEQAVISLTDYSDVKGAKKNVLCYNENNDNYTKTYSDYVKAFVCVNNNNEADFVIVVANGNDAAAYNVACENCK